MFVKRKCERDVDCTEWAVADLRTQVGSLRDKVQEWQDQLDRLAVVAKKVEYTMLYVKDAHYYQKRDLLIKTHKLVHKSKDSDWETWIRVETPKEKDE